MAALHLEIASEPAADARARLLERRLAEMPVAQACIPASSTAQGTWLKRLRTSLEKLPFDP